MSAIQIDLSPEVLASLERRALAKNRSLAEEVTAILEVAFEQDTSRRNDLISTSERSVPYDLPWSGPIGKGRGVAGARRLPDPV